MNWQHLSRPCLAALEVARQPLAVPVVNAVLMMIVTVSAIITAVPLFIASVLVGVLAIPEAAGPSHVCLGRSDRPFPLLLVHRPGGRVAAVRSLVFLQVHALAGLSRRGVFDQLSQLAGSLSLIIFVPIMSRLSSAWYTPRGS